MSDLSQMSDEEFMDAWTEASERAIELKAELREFAREHNDRLLKAEEDRKSEKLRAVEAGEVDPSLDQVVGSVEEN